MRHPELDYMMVMERRRDELTEAANYRLLKEARAANRTNSRAPLAVNVRQLRDALLLFLAQSLSLVGERMLNWSCKLQFRYRMLADSVAEQNPSPCS